MYFLNNDLLFGFKEKLECSHAIFALQQCAEYFVSRGSSVFMAPLDAKKAFDCLNHVKLFCFCVLSAEDVRYVLL